MAGPPNNQYAVLGSRLGFRLNYLTAAQKAQRVTWATFLLDGLPVKVRYNSVTIHDVINDTPDTCTLTIDARTPPNVGQRLTVRINTDAPRTLFAGPIQTVGLTYEGKPAQTVYPCQAIDDTPVANRKLPYGQWVNTSATTIGQWLVANFCPANYSSAGVQAGLPLISVNFDSTEGMDGCLRQMAKLIGGYFYWDDRTLHLFQDGEPGDTPDPIDASHPFLNDPPISVSTDTSQVRTRVYGKGYAESIIADVAANEAIVPISNAVMFNPAGGQAVTETQRLRYTGTDPGGGGTVVGPGIGPAAAPTLTLALGAGVTPGAHSYGITFQTAAGESIGSPAAAIAVGVLAPPATGPTAALFAGGNGPPGGATTYYAASFLTASGETLPGPSTAYTQPTIAAGTSPVTQIIDANDGTGYGMFPNLKPGDQLRIYYSYTADPTERQAPLPAAGETALSPVSATYTVKTGPFNPQNVMGFSFNVPYSADANVKFLHVWFSINGAAPCYVLMLVEGHWNPPNKPAQSYRYCHLRDCSPQYTMFFGTSNPIVGGVSLTGIPTGPAGVTGRKIYRWGPSGFALLTTLNDNTTTAMIDGSPDSFLGAAPPTTATAQAAQVLVSGLPLGPAAVTARKIYRTAAGGGVFKLLATVADNSTLTYLDAVSDASLGGAAPVGDTSGLQQPAGLIIAGAPSMVVAGAGWARVAGGWAIIGNGQQTIRYAAVSGNTLIGIPATGPGAITASVSYNSTVTAAALLLGVTGLLRALIKGAPINLWVQRDDLAAQAATALDGTDGIIEHLITDERRGETSLTQLCDADLAQYSTPIQTVPYATRDVKTKSGKPITFAIASPAIYATLTIQEVTITEINLAPHLNPRFTVSASSVRFSLEDMLRRLGASLDVTS